MWQPKLSASASTPLYRRLVEAMSRDIASGQLTAGQRLPPQRELAYTLSISVGAVTRAYDDAARRGLISAHVGRGTFVIDRSRGDAEQDGPIELSMNIAPVDPVAAMVDSIAALRRSTSWAERLAYQPRCGQDVDRRAGAAWLARTAGLEGLDWQRLICCPGAQSAIAIAFAALCKPGDTILCEAATFPGAKALAAQQGYQLHGVDMDAEGVKPQALDRTAAATGARVFYTLPTLQNPTTRVMGSARRADIVRVARARGLWIVEDDVYAPYARDLGLSPLAMLAPERTLYVSSLSKILSPGLRAGFLVAPAGEAFDGCAGALRAFMHSPAGVSAAIATDWIESGRADELARDVLAETGARAAMALDALDGVAEKPRAAMTLHLWLPMRAIDAERTAARALSAGVRLTSPGAFAVSDGKMASGLRLCLGSAASRATLRRALSILTDALSGKVDDRTHASL